VPKAGGGRSSGTFADMKPLIVVMCCLCLLAHPSKATSPVFTLQDRVEKSDVVAEVEVVKSRVYKDLDLDLPEAELQCRIIRSYKGDDRKDAVVRVHILNPDVKYDGNKFLLFAFLLDGRLRAFDGQRGLVPWDTTFPDSTTDEDPITRKFYRLLSFEELLTEAQRLCKRE